MTEIFKHQQPFTLESGKILPELHLAYNTFGTLNADGSNVIWIFHALTGNSNPLEWWHGLVGDNCLFTPEKYFIVCVNMPGSHYGSINALSINPETEKLYYHTFPWFTTRDMVRAYQHLKNKLGITKIHIGLGGSMGGQQLLEWAIEEPSLFENIVPIATNAFHSAWGVAFNASQRMCIEQDITWQESHEKAGINGMKAARSIALLSYRNHDTYGVKQMGFTSSTTHLPVDKQVFNAESYQRYQGEKLANRFNAFSYYALSKAMDSHNVGRDRVSVEKALAKITAKTMVIGVTTDILFPISEQQFLAANIANAKFLEIQSLYGHDGFLLEFEQIEKAIVTFINTAAE